MGEKQDAGEQGLKVEPLREYKGLGHDVIVAGTSAAVGGVAGAVTAQVTGHLLGGQKPPKEEGPKVILPPGVDGDS